MAYSLVSIITAGNIQQLRKCLKDGGRIDFADYKGWFPLHEAVFFNRSECVEELLTFRKSSLNWMTHKGETALLLACKHKRDEIVKLLLQHGANPNIHDDSGQLALIWAMRSSLSDECVHMLLESGASLSDALSYAETSQDDVLLKQLCLLPHGICDYDNELINAAECGNFKVIESLISLSRANANHISPYGQTAIHFAIARSAPSRIIDLLLDNMNPQKLGVRCSMSILHFAVEKKRHDTVERLVGMAFPVYSKLESLSCFENYELSPLYAAIQLSDDQSLKLLLKSGVDPNELTASDFSLLSFAIRRHEEKIVKLLIYYGSDVNVCHDKSYVPQAGQCAVANGYLDMLEFLLKIGMRNVTFYNAESKEVTDLWHCLVFSVGFDEDYVAEVLKILWKYEELHVWQMQLKYFKSLSNKFCEMDWSPFIGTPHSLLHLSRLKIRNSIMNRKPPSMYSCICKIQLFEIPVELKTAYREFGTEREAPFSSIRQFIDDLNWKIRRFRRPSGKLHFYTKMAPTTTIETVTIVRPLKVIAFICGLIVILLMILCLASSYWLTADRFRQGLWEHCVDEYAPTPLPFNITDDPGCYRARSMGYIQAAAALCVICLLSDVFATFITGFGLCSKDPQRKYLFYRIAVYVMVFALICVLIALVIYPACFAAEIDYGNRQLWEFGWAYGVGWGAAIFLFGAIVLLLCDKETDEIYYKERTIIHENGDSKA
uniref:Uncharacterized protein n=1 Tax=Strigamia maritima TaxID=126957 RepID=T1JJY3_STRMM